MFKKFLEERMSETSDYWSDLEMKTRRDIDSYTLSRRYFKKLRYYVNISMYYDVSRVMRKPEFCICENKDADQLRGNREADQHLFFAI